MRCLGKIFKTEIKVSKINVAQEETVKLKNSNKKHRERYEKIKLFKSSVNKEMN